MRKHRRPIDDVEILELLQEEPELLAIADALAATRERGERHRRPFRSLAAVALLAMATIVSTISYALLTGDEPSLSERALLAIGDGRVMHIVSERSESDRLLVDLRANRTRRVVTRAEAWFDSRVGVLRTSTSREETLVSDMLRGAREAGDERGQELGSFAVAAFARNYRRVLESGRVNTTGRAEVNGAPSVWIEFPVGRRMMRVAVIEQTGVPIMFAFNDGDSRAAWRISRLDSKEYLRADFAPEQTVDSLRSGRVVSERLLQLIRPPNRNGYPLWPGRTLGTLELRTALIQKLTQMPSTRGERTTGFKLVYRGDGEVFAEILQAREPEPVYGYSHDHLTLGLVPIPKENDLALMAPDERQRLWIGQFRTSGVYVTIRSPRRDIVIKAARTLANLS